MLMYRGEREGYYYIARHYGLALTYAFDSANADYVIIIEGTDFSFSFDTSRGH